MGGRALIASVAGGLVLSFGYGAWWLFTPLHAYSIRESEARGANMIMDSPEVRRLIAKEEKQEFPEVEFMAALAAQPSNLVAQNSYVQVLDLSRASCARDPHVTDVYARVRITSGPSRGKEGWLCQDKDFLPTIALR